MTRFLTINTDSENMITCIFKNEIHLGFISATGFDVRVTVSFISVREILHSNSNRDLGTGNVEYWIFIAVHITSRIVYRNCVFPRSCRLVIL